MSQADELLNGLVNEATAYSEAEPHIVIRADRTIEVPDSLKRIGVQHDHDVETVTFDCPRYWDEHDFLNMKIYIHYMRPDEKIGRYLTRNVVVDPIDENLIHFDWTISRNVTHIFGNISFIACAKQTDSEGVERVHWNSELNKDMYVSEGLEPENIEESDPDIVTQLLTRMDLVEKSDAVTAVKYYTEAREAAEEAKAEHQQLINDIAVERARIDQYLSERSAGQDLNTTVELLGMSQEGHAEGHIKSNGANAIFTLRALDKVVVADNSGLVENPLFLLEQEELCPLDTIRHRLDSMAVSNEFELYGSSTSSNGTLNVEKQNGHVKIVYEKTSSSGSTPMVLSDDGSSKNLIVRIHSIKTMYDDGPLSFDSVVVTMRRSGKEWPLYSTDKVSDMLTETSNESGITFTFNDQFPVGSRVEVVLDILDPNAESEVNLVIAPNLIYLEGDGACLVNEPVSISYPLALRTDAIPSDELYDIRVDIDGTTHPTAGEAVRSQVRKLHETQDIIKDNVSEFYDSSNFDSRMKSSLIAGGYVQGNYDNKTTRVCTKDAFYLPADAYVEIASGYKIAIHIYNSHTPSYDNCVEDSGWLELPIAAMSPSKYCTVTIAKMYDSDITVTEAKNAVKFHNFAYINEMLTIGQSDSNVMDSFLKSLLSGYSIDPDGDLISATTRVCSTIAMRFPHAVSLEIPNEYKLAVHTFSRSTINPDNHLTDSGWIESGVVSLPINTYCSVIFARLDGGNISVEEVKQAFKFRVPLDEKLEKLEKSNEDTSDFYYTGEPINFKKHAFKVKEIVSAPYTVHQGIQGFDIHNGIIAQFESDDLLRLIDIETGETISEYYCQGGHGSSLAFSGQYFESGDEFPMLYIAGCNIPMIFVQRITRTGTSLIARVKYSEEVAGYWATACFDFENKKMYVMGYTENSYSDNTSGNNLSKLTTWDMTQITSNEDGTISYALESTKTYPYVFCRQSLSFYDGKIFELISTTSAADTEIRVIDPVSGEVLSRFANFPSPIARGEGEGISFVDIGDSSQMIICVKGADKFTYYGFVF